MHRACVSWESWGVLFGWSRGRAGGGAEPCGGREQLWLLAQGGLWAEEPRDLTQVLPSTLAAVEGIDGGDTQGGQVTALVWMDDSELD